MADITICQNCKHCEIKPTPDDEMDTAKCQARWSFGDLPLDLVTGERAVFLDWDCYKLNRGQCPKFEGKAT